MKTILKNIAFFCHGLAAALFLGGASAALANDGPGDALVLSGTGSYAQAPNGVWFNGDFTVEGWVYVRSFNSWSRLIDFSDGPNATNVYLALTSGSSGLPAMGVFTNVGNPVINSSVALPLNQWAHLAATVQGTVGTIYINGVAVGSGAMNRPANVVRTNNYIGRSAYVSDGYANASFDEIRIWSVARTPSQIQATMHTRLAGTESNLVGYWPLDDQTGTIARDASGHGLDLTLVNTAWTPSSAPIGPMLAYTGGESSGGATQAILAGTVTPEANGASVFFQYGADTNYGNVSGASVISSSFTPVNITAPISTAAFPNATIHYRIVASNALGVVDGDDATFASFAAAPALGCLDPANCPPAALAVTGSSAVLAANVNPNNLPAKVWFRYGLTGSAGGYGYVSAVTNVPAAGMLEAVGIQLTGLQPNTVYHYGIIASNSVGAATLNDLVFSTPAVAPALSGLAAAPLTGSSARLSGFVNPQGTVTAYYFAYTPAGGGATVFTATNTLAGGQTATPVSAYAGPLAPNTCYGWTLFAVNQGGSSSLDAATPVCTPSGAPSVTTAAASGVTPHSALLVGQANPNGQDTQGFFLWGTSPQNLVNITAPAALGFGQASVGLSAGVAGLSPNALYYYRAVASNAVSAQFGAVVSFRTPQLPNLIPPPQGVYVVTNGHTRTATGVALVGGDGSLSTVYLTDGGLGYSTPPQVTVVPRGAGSGGVVVATVANGSLTSLAVQDPGSYDLQGLTLVIDPPPNEIQAAADNPAYDTIILPHGSIDATVTFTRNMIVHGQGPAFTTVNGAGRGSVFDVKSGANVVFEDLTITGGAATNGGGIFNEGGTVSVENCQITGNSAQSLGGGIMNYGNAILTLNDTTISGNAAGLGGAGLCGDGIQTASIPNLTNALQSVSNAVGSFFDAFKNYESFQITIVKDLDGHLSYLAPDIADAIAHAVQPGTIEDEAKSLAGALEDFGSKFENLASDAFSDLEHIDEPGKIRSSLAHPFGSSSGGGNSGWLQLGASICTASNCAIVNNLVTSPATGFGGGVHNELGLMVLTRTQITDNRVAGALGSFGGGVSSLLGALTLDGCVVSNNTANSTTVLAGGGGVFTAAGLLRATNCAVKSNVTSAKMLSSGGGVFSLGTNYAEITLCQITGNTSGGGGGVANENGATINFTNCFIASNSASGIISSFGGGIRNRGQGTVSLYGCTLLGNSVGGRAKGGGLYNEVVGTRTNFTYPVISQQSTATLVNCTVVSNTATAGTFNIPDPASLAACLVANQHFPQPGGCALSTIPAIEIPLDSRGGGIYNGAQAGSVLAVTVQSGLASLALSSCTVAGNAATGTFSDGGGLFNTSVAGPNPLLLAPASASIDNTLFAGNTDNALPQDVMGDGSPLTSFTSFGYNLDSDHTLAFLTTNIFGGGPVTLTQTNWALGPLAYNGGATPTMALLSNSLALNAGNPAAADGSSGAPQPIDQRGVARPQFGRADIGAFEAAPTMLSNQSYTALENQLLQVGAANGVFSNSIGAGLRIFDYSSGDHGRLTIAPDGSFTFLPATNFVGSEYFLYEVAEPISNIVSEAELQITTLPVLQFTSNSTSLSPESGPRGGFDLGFNAALDPATAPGGIIVRGAESVVFPTAAAVDGTNVSVAPETSFHAGELVTVELLKSLVATNGGALLHPKTFQYVTAVAGGSGVFPTAKNFGHHLPIAVSLADLDGNGTIDAYVAGQLSLPDQVWLNDGHGNFTLAQELPGNSTGVALADLNGDGFPDAVVTKAGGLLGVPNINIQTASVPSDYNRVYFNDGTGHFVESQQGLIPGTVPVLATLQNGGTISADEAAQLTRIFNQGSSGVAIGDLDGDGIPDVVLINNTTLNYGGHPISTPGNSVWINDGNGGFKHTQTFDALNSFAVALADINGDGFLDIVVGDVAGLEIYLNDGSGHFTQGQTIIVGGLVPVVALAVGDLNGDGAMDVVASFAGIGGGSQLFWNQVYLNDGNGALTNGQRFVGQVQARSLALGDLNGDGSLDFFGTGIFGSEVWLNNGAGVFTRKGAPFNTGYIGQGVALGDLDGDGDLDAFNVNTLGSLTSSANAEFVFFNDSAPSGAGQVYSVAEGGSLSVPAPGLLGSVVDLDGPTVILQLTEPRVYTAATLGQLYYLTYSVPNWNSANIGEDAQGNWTYTDIVPVYSAHGAVHVAADGSFTYAPNPGFYGTDSFPLVISDGYLTTSNTVTINVTEIVQPPMAQDDFYAFSGSPVTVAAAQGVLANDQDLNSLTLTASLLQGPAHGNVTLNANGSFTYTPNAGYSGPDVFTYQAADVQSSNSARVNLGNSAPLAVSDYYPMPPNGAITVGTLQGVLANDSDPEGDAITAILTTAPTHGQLTLHADGSFAYARFTNYSGDDSFYYAANDGFASSTPVLVRLGDTAPVGNADSFTAFANQPFSISPVLGVLKNDTDPDNYPLRATLVSGASHGALALQADGSFTYTAAANYVGPDSFTYTASDGVATSAVTTVTLAVRTSTLLLTAGSPNGVGPTNAVIQLQFNAPVDPQLAGLKLGLFGTISGAHSWTGTASNEFVSIVPSGRFLPGEKVTVAMGPGLQGFGNTALGSGFNWSFYVSAPRGAGSFSQTVVDTSNQFYLERPVAGDFVGHGLPDVIAAYNYDNNPYYAQLHRFHNNGDRTFTDEIMTDPVSPYPRAYESVVPGDFDGDGHLDLFVRADFGDPDGPREEYWHNDGTGNFIASVLPHNPSEYATEIDNTFVGAGDVNGDGSLDVIGLSGTSTIWTLTNDGVGNLVVGPTTTIPAIITAMAFGNEFFACSLGDVNGDGKLDLIIATATTGQFWTNDGAGHFAQMPGLTDLADIGAIYMAGACGDLTGDGLSDVLILNGESPTGNPLKLYQNLGGNLFSSSTVSHFTGVNLLLADDVAPTMLLGDLTGRGRLDAVLSSSLTANEIYFNDGTGHFSSASLPGAPYNYGLALADLDGDGAVDIFVAGGAASDHTLRESVLWNRRPPLAVNDYYPAGTTSVAANGVLANDAIGDAGPISAALIAQPANATIALAPDGSFTVTPGPGYAGITAFNYNDTDAGGSSYAARVKIGNTAPVATNVGPLTVLNSAPLVVAATSGLLTFASDAEGDPLTAQLVAKPLHGSVSVSAGGGFTYIPDAAYSGLDTFVYQMSDGVTNSAPATVTIDVIQTLHVTQLTPALNALNVAPAAPLVLTFDRAIDSSTVPGAVVLSSAQNGRIPFLATIASNVITLKPAGKLHAADVVTALLSGSLRGGNGERLPGPIVWQFTVDAPVGRVGLLDSGARYTLPPYSNSVAAACADVNGDGSLDVIVAQGQAIANQAVIAGSSATMVWTNNGSGVLVDSGQRLWLSEGLASMVFPADFNGDGAVDFLLMRVGITPLQLWTNNGAGHFAAGNAPAPTGFISLAVGDLNGDGYPDIAGVQYNYPNSAFLVLTNDRAGNFQTAVSTINLNATAVALGDFNNDGRIDLLEGVNYSDTASIVMLTNDGSAHFTPAATAQPQGQGTSAMAVGDFNGDGYLDFVTWDNDIMEVWLNTGHGGFVNSGQEINVSAGQFGSITFQIGDFNGDGALDIVTRGYGVSVFYNDGHGHFGSPTALPLPANLTTAAMGDLNGDGAPDLFIPGDGPSSEVYNNKGGLGGLEGLASLLLRAQCLPEPPVPRSP
jgi:hypothetical protein